MPAAHPEATLELVGPLHVAPKAFVDPFGQDPLLKGLAQHFKQPERYLRFLQARARATGRGTFAGAVANEALPRRYGAAGVFVFPSLWQEPFGIPVIEAMAAGLPVIASRPGALPEIIEDGVTGRLVAAHDLAAFGRRVSELLADPHAAERMGVAAQTRVREHFLGPRHLGQYVELLETVLR